ALIDWVARTPIFLKTLQCENDPPRAQALSAETVDRLVADGVLALQTVGDEQRVVLTAGD
ncbi:MAG: hypothetical protein Q7S91_04405, partial [Aquabacterium sp.]|nr:hypothetical protein [Aquabacterium sp.]